MCLIYVAQKAQVCRPRCPCRQAPQGQLGGLLEDAGAFAEECGRHELQDLRASKSPGAVRNISRDMRRRMLRRSHWPPIYIAEVPFWSQKEKAMVPRKLAFLLPHELIAVLQESGQTEALTQTDGLDAPNQERYGAIFQKLDAPFVALSLWGDGVPVSWDRKKSVDIWTLAFPGMAQKKDQDLRTVLTAMPHENVVRATQDGVMSILCWSLQALAKGAMPACRHDGEEWHAADAWRKSRSSNPLLHAALVEIKGDWKQLHFCFAIPGWMSRADAPICWRCRATKTSLRTDTGVSFLDPGFRLSHWQCMQRILESDGGFSPIWGVPGCLWMPCEWTGSMWQTRESPQCSLVVCSTWCCRIGQRDLMRTLGAAGCGAGFKSTTLSSRFEKPLEKTQPNKNPTVVECSGGDWGVDHNGILLAFWLLSSSTHGWIPPSLHPARSLISCTIWSRRWLSLKRVLLNSQAVGHRSGTLCHLRWGWWTPGSLMSLIQRGWLWEPVWEHFPGAMISSAPKCKERVLFCRMPWPSTKIC